MPKWFKLPIMTLALLFLLNISVFVFSQDGSSHAEMVQASFTTTPTSGTVPLTVQFDASTPTGSNLTYEWDFGDGTTGSEVQIEHTYEALGYYKAQLKVSNDSVSDLMELPVTVSTYTEGNRTKSFEPINDIASVIIPFGKATIGRDFASFSVGPNAITKTTSIEFTLSSTPATTYPDDSTFKKLYPSENVVPIGPVVTFELRYDSIVTSDSETIGLFVATPALYENVQFEDYAETGIEVRILRADGTEDFYLEDSFPGGSVVFYDDTFAHTYGNNPPEIIKVSVQPVDYLGVTQRIENSLPTLPIQSSLQTQVIIPLHQKR
jgi:PKD repeat protein